MPRRPVVLLALALAACTTRTPEPGTEAADVAALPRELRQRMVFDSVWTIVAREHVDSTLAGTDWAGARAALRERAAHAPDERGLYLVLSTLLAPLGDAHTYVTTPTRVRRDVARRTAARGDGLGMTLEPLGGAVVVSAVQPRSAAGRSGVQPGWVVTTWNGNAVDSATVASGRFAAGRGDTVALAFADSSGSALERVLVPAPYRWRHPRGVVRVRGVPVVRLTSFEPGMGAWFAHTLDTLAGERAIVLDLRGNPGGQMRELSVASAALFRGPQAMGRFIARDGTSGAVEAAGAGTTPYAGRLVALVDRHSGSAAEILAATLQNTGRGRVVGERTAGAVLNAFAYRLPDGGELHVSRRDFRDACDVRLEKTGVAPRDTLDVAVRSLDDARRGRDRALERAIAVLASGEPAPTGCAIGVLPSTAH